jgi:hypothetical protein
MFHGVFAGALLVTPVGAPTQPPEQIATPQIEYLCPLPALANVTLGATLASQDVVMLENLKSLKKLGPHFAPFTQADLEITAWSQRIAGVSYVAESPEGPTNEKWGAAFEQSLLEAGWLVVSRKESKSPFVAEPRSFEKQMETPLGRRTLFLRFDTPGALVLRCGDLKLFDVQKNERDGVLEPGSLRPVAPARTAPHRTAPAAQATDADCENATLLEAFKEPGIVDEANPALQAFVERAQDVADERRYGSRLLTWLKWKLVASGRVLEERIWQIQDEAAPRDLDAAAAAVTDLLGSVVGMDDAQQQANPKAICTTMLRFMDWQIKTDATDIAYHSKWTQALEKEAQRLGVNID